MATGTVMTPQNCIIYEVSWKETEHVKLLHWVRGIQTLFSDKLSNLRNEPKCSIEMVQNQDPLHRKSVLMIQSDWAHLVINLVCRKNKAFRLSNIFENIVFILFLWSYCQWNPTLPAQVFHIKILPTAGLFPPAFLLFSNLKIVN